MGRPNLLLRVMWGDAFAAEVSAEQLVWIISLGVVVCTHEKVGLVEVYFWVAVLQFLGVVHQWSGGFIGNYLHL